MTPQILLVLELRFTHLTRNIFILVRRSVGGEMGFQLGVLVESLSAVDANKVLLVEMNSCNVLSENILAGQCFLADVTFGNIFLRRVLRPDVYFEGLGRGEGGGAVTTVQFIRVVRLTVSFKKTSIIKQFPAHFTREVLFLMVDHIHVRLQVGLGVELFHTTFD